MALRIASRPQLQGISVMQAIFQPSRNAGTLIQSRKPKRKYRYGETRPAVYYEFDCLVELSDGSTYTRRSQFPRNEWRYLFDQRVHPTWNPNVPGLAGPQTVEGGRMARFVERLSKSQGENAEEVDDILEDDSYKANSNIKLLNKKERRY
ncbi:hypothetical protein V1514DRAFT_337058 [Lipomyces japonicus]|uniref:mitochondrial 54S ribosomal protein bL31m n=1 Tax=Lipomyces japonicus TaxID=56871 RepID=UPI0034CD16E1